MAFFRPLDVLVLLSIAAAATGSFFLTDNQAGSRAEIYVGNKKVASLDINQPVQEKDISTGIGMVRVKFGDGRIAVTRSPCAQKLCIHQGAIQQTSQHIICLPAQLQIVIIGGNQSSKPADGLDAISY